MPLLFYNKRIISYQLMTLVLANALGKEFQVETSAFVKRRFKNRVGFLGGPKLRRNIIENVNLETSAALERRIQRKRYTRT